MFIQHICVGVKVGGCRRSQVRPGVFRKNFLAYPASRRSRSRKGPSSHGATCGGHRPRRVIRLVRHLHLDGLLCGSPCKRERSAQSPYALKLLSFYQAGSASPASRWPLSTFAGRRGRGRHRPRRLFLLSGPALRAAVSPASFYLYDLLLFGPLLANAHLFAAVVAEYALRSRLLAPHRHPHGLPVVVSG